MALARHGIESVAYALSHRIIREFYLAESDKSKRPKIFGMTASPVDAKVDVRQAAKYDSDPFRFREKHTYKHRELEDLLHCQIATASDLALLQQSVTRPSEEVICYRRLRTPFETPLYAQLKARFGDVEAFQRLFVSSKEASSQLGRWCSDMYWSFALAEEQARKMEMRTERAFNARRDAKPVAILDAELAKLREAAQIVQCHDFGQPTASLEDLSSKVMELYAWLQLYFERPSDARCIVFVDRRHTARLLQLIFSHIGGPHLRPDILVGNNTAGNVNVSFRKQFMTLTNFRKGAVNCLV